MKILSVCTNLPTQSRPLHGLFVRRRLEKMAELASVRALIPQPWFPVVQPRRPDPPISNTNLIVDHASMFYVPGIANHWNGRFMKRCVGKWLDTLGAETTSGAILDAHFGYPEGVACFLAARKRKMPVFITMRGLEVELFNTPSRGRQLVEALCNATGVITVSHSLKEAAMTAGVPEEQITVIPNGVDTETFCSGDRGKARDAVGYQNTDKLVVSVGNLKQVKGHDTLIRAIASVATHNPIQLVCIGGGVNSPWGKKLQKLAEELGIRNRVHLVGAKPTNEVVHWLQAADLFALASRREGCCNAVLEALSTGLPVVVTDAGDNRKMVESPQCGRIVATENPEELANTIIECLDFEFDYQSIEESVQDWTWTSVAKKVIATFDSGIL